MTDEQLVASNRALSRQQINKLANKLIQEHGVRPAFRPHVLSVLGHCADEARMLASLESLYRQPATRRWFF